MKLNNHKCIDILTNIQPTKRPIATSLRKHSMAVKTLLCLCFINGNILFNNSVFKRVVEGRHEGLCKMSWAQSF